MTTNDKSESIDASVQKEAESPQRRRVLDLLQRMARTTALGGAAIGLAATEGCPPFAVDPLPPPFCADPTRVGLQLSMSLSGSWVSGDSGSVRVRLYVSSHDTVTFSPAVALSGATLVQTATTTNAIEVLLSPDAGAAAVTVHISVDCSGQVAAIVLNLDVRNPVLNANVPITVVAP